MHENELYDEKSNHIDTTIFESYLSKFIIENKSFYEKTYFKVNLSIKKYIEDNYKTPRFDRSLFLLFSNFSQDFPDYTCMDDFFKKGFNVQACDRFHKQFFETMLPKGAVCKPLVKDPKKVYSLSELVQFTINKNKSLETKLKTQLRPNHLFTKKNRSRIEIKDKENANSTVKLGIAKPIYTPPELKQYYSLEYVPADFLFKRDRSGSFSLWLQERNLPFISGASGSGEILFRAITSLDTYTPKELREYFLGAAAAMVSRGHHSFAEVMIIANELGFKLEDFEDRLKFYEQFLTPEVLQSKEYAKFLEMKVIEEYFLKYKELDLVFPS